MKHAKHQNVVLDGERGDLEDNQKDSVMPLRNRTFKNGGTKGPLRMERK